MQGDGLTFHQSSVDFGIFVVRHRLWLVLVPLVYNLDIMILTDVPWRYAAAYYYYYYYYYY